MKKRFAGALVLMIIAVGMTGCDVGEEEAGPPEDFTPGEIDQLVDTVWRFEEFEVAFQEPPDVIVRGEPIRSELGLEEVTGAYTLDEEGFIEISAVNEIRMGTWDGDELIVDGITGERID